MDGLIRFEWRRPCPTCGGTDSTLCRKSRGEGRRLQSTSYSARKTPEAVYPAYRRCRACRTFYASPAPAPEGLDYENCDDIAEEEAEWAARAYVKFLEPRLPSIARGPAVDIGCGKGNFLARLSPQQFPERVGFELARHVPDREGIRIERKVFGDLERKAALITAFQVLEHVPSPLEVLTSARESLVEDGLFFTVAHNEESWAHRALGKRSPMLDHQHFQLFSPKTLAGALRRAGFREVETFPFANTYPLHYWAKLAPLPDRLKHWLRGKAWSERPVELSLGNFAAFARR